jgi:diguanylate cyclase (GGDEF)-like protein
VAAPLRQDDTSVAGCVVLLHDASHTRSLARQLSHQATHDALTGLVNRRELERRLADAVGAGRAGAGPQLLCHLDLEGLRAVNDAGGSHQAGDAVLREAARLLRGAVRSTDTVARVGGDEFAILLQACPLTKGRQIAEDLCRQMSVHRYRWNERFFTVGVSAGLVEMGHESGTAQDVLSAAEAACYLARHQSPGRVLVYSARDESLARHSGEIRWLQRLANALRDGRLELYQQPIVAAGGGAAGGPALEMLVRLKDEAGEELAPADMLGAAERYQLTGHIDRWVVQTTLNAIARGQISLAAQRSVAINISPQTLRDPQFLNFVVDTLDSTSVPPARVCFEISERAVVSDIEQARRFAGALHAMGCEFTLDDFGAHGGSLTGLKSLPLNYVKIDGCLVRDLARDPVNQALVGSMIRLARSLRFKVIAEQVEEPTALEAVRTLGVDYVQGYLIGRPVPLAPGETMTRNVPTVSPPSFRLDI